MTTITAQRGAAGLPDAPGDIPADTRDPIRSAAARVALSRPPQQEAQRLAQQEAQRRPGTLRIEGIPDPVSVDASFADLSPDQQAQTVEHIRAEWQRRQNDTQPSGRTATFMIRRGEETYRVSVPAERADTITPDELLAMLDDAAAQPPTPSDVQREPTGAGFSALQYGARQGARGLAATARVMGDATDNAWLQRQGRELDELVPAPRGYVPSGPAMVQAIREGRYADAAGNLPATIMEAIPGMGATMAAGAAGSAVGGPVGGLAAAGTAAAAQTFGNVAEERAARDGVVPTDPTNMLAAAGTTAVSAGLDAAENWPRVTPPDMWICYRTNPAISSWNAPEVAERLAEFPFIVAFSYTEDETNHFADILLPEASDLESLQIIRIGSTKFTEQFWKHEGWAIRQPLIESHCDVMDFTDISTALAERAGILPQYVKAVNKGAAGMALRARDGSFDYALDETKKPERDQIWNAFAHAASHDLSKGEEVHDLDWFKEAGFMLRPFPQIDWYLYPALERQNLRFELPYQERIVRHGRQLANRLHEIGVEWWEHQLAEYEYMPTYEPFPEIWIEYAREYGRDPDEFPFWALTARSMQYSWGANVGLPLINEVANNVAGHKGVIINRTAARRLGIAEGERIILESVSGHTEGSAVLREGIRPDTVLMIGQFDHWKTPFAKDLNLPSLNSVTDLSLKLTDGTGSGADVMRIRLRRASNGELLGAPGAVPQVPPMQQQASKRGLTA